MIKTLAERVSQLVEGDPGWIGSTEQRIAERIRQMQTVARECAEIAARSHNAKEAETLIKMRFELDSLIGA